MKINKLYKLPLVFFASLLMLAACGGAEPEPEQPLDERVLARWGHMIERDFEAAWAYHSPGFRQTTPVEDFVRDMTRRPLRWHDVELLTIDCTGEDVCEVRLEITFQAVGAPSGMGRMRIPNRSTERWVRIDGQWWYSAN